MANSPPFVVTISRQLGSGGAYVGRQLATSLGIAYADRDILEKAAEALRVQARDVEARDEVLPSMIDSIVEAFTFSGVETSYVPQLDLPTHDELRQAETRVIREIAARKSAVIVGRAGFYVLNQHVRHFSVFLHASLEFRVRRVQELFEINRDRALKAIDENDHARGRYLQDITGRNWTDSTQYDLSICTSTLGLMLAARTLVETVRTRFRVPLLNKGATPESA